MYSTSLYVSSFDKCANHTIRESILAEASKYVLLCYQQSSQTQHQLVRSTRTCKLDQRPFKVPS
jgi:hypothetical protein